MRSPVPQPTAAPPRRLASAGPAVLVILLRAGGGRVPSHPRGARVALAHGASAVPQVEEEKRRKKEEAARKRQEQEVTSARCGEGGAAGGALDLGPCPLCLAGAHQAPVGVCPIGSPMSSQGARRAACPTPRERLRQCPASLLCPLARVTPSSLSVPEPGGWGGCPAQAGQQ